MELTTPDLNGGALAPVMDEADLDAAVVVGQIPPQLHGSLVRNGPNPFSGRFSGNDVLSWWPEAAMLHSISFSEGRMRRYRNRWVRTRNWAKHFDGNSTQSALDTNPNVSVIRHAGEILALAEGGVPLTINADLETLGPTIRLPTLAQGMTAHPKIDPVSGELIAFQADWSKPWLQYVVTDSAGVQRSSARIAVPAPAMMHDFAITPSHSILLDLNVAYDFSMLSRGYRIPLRWHEERVSRLGVMTRAGEAVRWFEIHPCFIQHVVNAYDADPGTIVLEVVRYPWYLRLEPATRSFEPNPLGVLWRYVIDLKLGAVREHQLDDVAIELPRINETLTGRKNRYVYAVEQPDSSQMRGIVRYDREHCSWQRHTIPEGDQNSEPVFVPRPDAVTEDDGWVLVCVYRQATDSSDVIVLDAHDLASAPLATVHLPRRIPAGFHGAWLDET